MTFSFDGETRLERRRCDRCGEAHDAATGFVLRDGAAYAIYWADWYPHQQEALVDVILGSFEEPDFADNVTFGCRIGRVEGQAEPACSLTPGGQSRSVKQLLGHKLTREEALQHPSLPSFWEVVDWLILNDATLHEHIFHIPPKPDSSS